MNALWLLCAIVGTASLRAAAPIPNAPRPNDSYWPQQWYLENADTNGVRFGYDMNARSAWSISRGAGVTIAIVDDGVELAHPDLAQNAATNLHWNFEKDIPSGEHPTSIQFHGTAVAGLAAAEGNNHRGISGMAPEAKFASWVIFHADAADGNIVGSNQLAKMFDFHLNEIDIQNHSWALPRGARLASMSAPEDAAISNAVTAGRGGRGVVMIRAAGNDRGTGRNANEDAYTADPREITVAGLLPDGTVSGSSTPGAPILVAAPGGQFGVADLFTTDRLGTLGFNRVTFPGTDLSDYAFGTISGFAGTSAAAPLVSGVTALMLSANPALTVRDVQQILVLSASQTDPTDIDVRTNGAGLLVNHNSGFGLVNAGTAVDLARNWTNRPAAAVSSNTVTEAHSIPDGGLRVNITSSASLPAELQSIVALPSLGFHPDDPTENLPLVFVGEAVNPLQTNLMGKGALIRRGGGDFAVKIQNAADAGAAFAIMLNNQGGDKLEIMGGTDRVAIPAVFISQNQGEAIVNLLSNNQASAQITLARTEYEIPVSDALICEHVRLVVQYSHESRGDIRLTLTSPAGTRSVLQPLGPDTNAFSGTWTYMTTHHFLESSQGPWRVAFSDEAAGGTGIVQNVTLLVSGVHIEDSDRDGLDDRWETAALGNLNYGPKDDPDEDGYTNAREQVMGTNPALNESPLAVDLSRWNERIVRMNWPSRAGIEYEVLASPDLRQPFSVISTVVGVFPRTEWLSSVEAGYRFFTVRERKL